MRSRLKVDGPNKIVYTLTTTATAEEWCQFRDALDNVARSAGAPDSVYHFRTQITDLLAQARKIYWPREEEGA